MSSTGVSKCAKSRQKPPAEKWSLANLLKTHRVPAPSWGQHPMKMASPYHHPSMSSTSASKCAKSRQEPPAGKWSLADLLKTHRGPAPSWGQHPLKRAGPYLKLPWSSTAQSKCPGWKMKFGQSARNSQGTCPCPWPPSLKMEKFLALSSKEQARH